MDQQNNQGLSGSTHLTPAEAGRLLGKSSAQIREMIRRGELTQEQLEGRWLIPLRDINKIVDPSFGEGDRKQRMAGNERRSKPGKKRHKGKLHEGESSRQRGTSKAPIVKKTRDLAGEVERLERKMKRIDDELRDLRSGLMNDEKRGHIEKLKIEKRKVGKTLQKVQAELSRRENHI